MVLTTTGTLDDVLDSTHTLRENIFHQIKFKHFADTNDSENYKFMKIYQI